jgi:hypothetical protein
MFKTIQKKLEGTGLQAPPTIPIRHFKTVLCIAEAQTNGRLDQLRTTHPRLYWVLLTRFGLIGRCKERRYKTLENMNLADGGRVSRTRIWQVIRKDLRWILLRPCWKGRAI